MRVVKIDGEPWFVAKDVAAVLGYSDAEAMTRRLDSDDRQNLRGVGFGPRGVTAINEPGLYVAVLGSQKPEAKRFKKWVTGTVLPAIRKDGAYIMGEERVASGELDGQQAGSTAARNSWCSPPPARRQEQARQHQRGSRPALPWPAASTRHGSHERTPDATSTSPPSTPQPARAPITHHARPQAETAIQERQAGNEAHRRQ